MPAPRVSILMPMRNAQSFVGDALRSVLGERDVPLEVIVADDGSTDRSRSVVEAIADRRIRIVDGPGQGIAAAFNTALSQARGDIVMRCDADDLYPPRRISDQARWLDEHGEFGAVCGDFAAMNARGGNRTVLGMSAGPMEITAELSGGLVRTSFCTFAVRTSCLRELGGARSFFRTAEDVDLQLRLSEMCRIWYMPEIAYLYRLHNASITHTSRAQTKDYFERQARVFQMQRRQSGTDELQQGKAAEPPLAGAVGAGTAARHLQDLLIGKSWAAYQEGAVASALSLGLRAVLARPFALAGWRNLAALAAKLIVGDRPPAEGSHD